MTETLQEALPRWDLTPFYPDVETPELAGDVEAAVAAVEALEQLFDRHGVRAGGSAAIESATFDELLERLNAVLEQIHVVGAYLYARVAADTRDAAAQGRMSELGRHEARLAKLAVRFTGWLGELDLEPLLQRSQQVQAHAFALREAQEESRHLMSQGEEELAADLDLSGASAWRRLHGDVTSQVTVSFATGDEARERPMSEIRSLGHDRDRDVRRRAYEAELAAWERSAVPLAAALNAVKWQTLTLTGRRGWESPLDAALFANRIDRATLDALQAAVREATPELRRYLRAKARALGLDALAWYDVAAPMGEGGRVWRYGDAERFVVEQFGVYSERMRDYAARAFSERWIDAEPRPGKVDGAFCLSVRGEESRVLANYSPSYYGVSTLAHELGHGYHNLQKAALTPIQRQTPMTLAETASTFCETIVRQAALAQASPGEQLEILEGSLQDSTQVTLDIQSRFLFERRLFERRRERELSAPELCELMVETQRETYADGLDGEHLHPYMWAVKGHYYSSERSFYNFPYTFGLLFGLGLFARYREDPERFRAGYDDLLASTGAADAATLAARFGIDVRSEDFWRSSLAVIRADVDRFEELVRG
jgi:oligoendopeptidase F